MIEGLNLALVAVFAVGVAAAVLDTTAALGAVRRLPLRPGRDSACSPPGRPARSRSEAGCSSGGMPERGPN